MKIAGIHSIVKKPVSRQQIAAAVSQVFENQYEKSDMSSNLLKAWSEKGINREL